MAVVGYNANGTLVSATKGAGVRVAISAIANTTPIEVTTSGAHGFNTSDTIEQEGTSGIADGQYQITKVDGTHYLLNGSTANGAGSTGYAIDYELQPAVQIASPGDPASMVTLAPVLQGAINPQPFLYRRAGKWRFYNQYNLLGGNLITTPFISNPWSTNTNFTSTTVVALASATATFESCSDTTGLPPVFKAGDMLDISVSFTATGLNHSSQHVVTEIGFGLVQGGSLASTIGAPSVFFDSQGTVQTAGALSLSSQLILASGGGLTFPTSALSWCIFARIDFISSAFQFDLTLIGTISGFVNQYRAN